MSPNSPNSIDPGFLGRSDELKFVWLYRDVQNLETKTSTQSKSLRLLEAKLKKAEKAIQDLQKRLLALEGQFP